jgi:branched-chain amino acid aminotransferase
MECYLDYYIHNFKVKSSAEFDESVLESGQSIYEVIRIEEKIPLFLEEHLNRLFDSAELSNLQINESYCDIELLIEELIKKNQVSEGKIKLVIHFDPNNGIIEKDLLMYFTPHYFPTNTEYIEGVEVGICHAVRSNPNAKLLNTEARKKANNTIVEEKLFEVLLMNHEGFITEGSRSNVFFIQNDIVITPPRQHVLNGITRRNIIKLCKKNGIKIIEEGVQFADIQQMDAVFLSGTSLKVLPVNFWANQRFNTKNKTLRTIMKIYDQAIEDYILSKQSV